MGHSGLPRPSWPIRRKGIPTQFPIAPGVPIVVAGALYRRSVAIPAPPELGRGVVLGVAREAPAAWTKCERVRVDDRALENPTALLSVLHDAWLSRRAVVVELVCDPAMLRVPERYQGPVYELDPAFEFLLERIQFLVWTNTYDGRSGELIWWHARKLARQMARAGVTIGGPGDVCLKGGAPLYIDGGPPDPPALPTGVPVVHRWNAEAGNLLPTAHRPPSALLAPDQLAAVAHGSGGARVIAPAGSGKTRVLTERLRHLVEDRAVDASSVTAVAFNTRAAAEMQERCRGILRSNGPNIRTLNSLGLWICNEFGEGGRLEVLDELGARDLVQTVFPVQRQANADTVAPYLDALSAVRLGLRHPEVVEAEIPDASGIAERFLGYREALAARGVVDFDEQIYRAIEILVTDPGAREQAQRRCRRLLVDEFQDLNPAHLLLIRLLCAPGYDCFGVGDDDQVIYGYSGATPAFLLGFPRYFPGAGHHMLEVNYRCPPAIVGAARHLLSYNRQRPKKRRGGRGERNDTAPLPTGPLAGKGSVAVVRTPGDQLASRCVEVIEAWRGDGADLKDIAVLARVNSALLPVLVGCLGAGIPVSSSLGPAVLRRTGVRAALAYLRIGCAPERITQADIAETLRRPSRKISRNVTEILTSRPYSSLPEVRRLAGRLSGGDVRKLDDYATDIETIAAACKASSSAALRAVRLAVGLGASVDALDHSRGEADRSTHSDDLIALESVAALHPDPATFETWLREILTRPSPSGPSVLLSTVHKIKGNEWPRVIVFGATKGLFPHRLADDDEGERRVFHVAITRAITQVVVVADTEYPSPFVQELDRAAPPTTPSAARPASRRHSEPGHGAQRGSPRGDARRTIAGRLGRPSGRRPRRGRAHAVAVIGLEFQHGGQSATVVEIRDTGVVVRIGALRTEVAFGTEVHVDGQLKALMRPDAPSADPARAIAAEAALRSWRSTAAKEARVPAYVILTDAELQGIAERMPATPEELASCRGMGSIRLERYGDEILAILESVSRGDQRSPT
jgi:DNA helicase II / ATP-dependent DNA helicase PcrA